MVEVAVSRTRSIGRSPTYQAALPTPLQRAGRWLSGGKRFPPLSTVSDLFVKPLQGVVGPYLFPKRAGAVDEGQDTPFSVTFYNRNFLTWPTYTVSIVPLNDEIGSTTLFIEANAD